MVLGPEFDPDANVPHPEVAAASPRFRGTPCRIRLSQFDGLCYVFPAESPVFWANRTGWGSGIEIGRERIPMKGLAWKIALATAVLAVGFLVILQAQRGMNQALLQKTAEAQASDQPAARAGSRRRRRQYGRCQ